MNVTSLLNIYFLFNLLIALGYLANKFLMLFQKNLRFCSMLKWNYFLISMIFGLVLLNPFLPQKTFFSPVAKVMSATSLNSFSSEYDLSKGGGYLNFSSLGRDHSMNVEKLNLMFSFIFFFIITLSICFLIYEFYKLGKLYKSSFHYLKNKNVLIKIHDSISVPFSFAFGLKAIVVVPSSLVLDREFFKIAIFHELQHHRQRDTLWVYPLWVMKSLCFVNPFAHLWSRDISTLQEFSCDEILIGQKKISSDSYAHCLIAVAQSSLLKTMKAPFCATGLTFLAEDNIIKRRIQFMYEKKLPSLSLSKQAVLFTSMFLLFLGSAFASKGIVQDKRITQAEAEELVLKTKSEIPIELNEAVLLQLNRYAGTPEGRLFFKDSLERMRLYQFMIEGKLVLNNLPLELMAIPIVESGYQNLPQDPNHKTWGAGIWMFIESTARVYGLRVDKVVDERLNPYFLTDAAIKYLQSNYGLFSDWKLSILAYNIGERNVMKAMAELKTKDAWTIIKNGRENDKDYLARVMAAVIILKNQDLLN